MGRIDVQTLVLAFEKRISELEKNPPDKISTGVIVSMLESSIDHIIKNHFVHLIKKEIEEHIHKEFKKMKNSFIKTTVKNILTDSNFRESVESKIKRSIIDNIK